jgi:2-methylcitrate dehydratase PrpD
VAIILLDGELDFVAAQSLERMRSDSAVLELMERVEVVHDPDQEHAPGEPRRESARVTVWETSGVRHEIFVPHVVGFPSHPMDRPQVEATALGLMTPALGGDRAREIVDRVRDLDAEPRAADLVELIAS